MTLSLTGWALAWATAWAYQGRWAMSAWAMLVLVPHTPALALELLWASRLARQESARRTWGDPQAAVQPYPGLAQWFKAGYQEALMGLRVFAWPMRITLRPRRGGGEVCCWCMAFTAIEASGMLGCLACARLAFLL